MIVIEDKCTRHLFLKVNCKINRFFFCKVYFCWEDVFLRLTILLFASMSVVCFKSPLSLLISSSFALLSLCFSSLKTWYIRWYMTKCSNFDSFNSSRVLFTIEKYFSMKLLISFTSQLPPLYFKTVDISYSHH